MSVEEQPSSEAVVTPTSSADQTSTNTGWAYVVIGFGIGFLTGLSVSPVVYSVIASLIGLAAGIVAAMSGLKNWPGTLSGEQEKSTTEQDKRSDTLITIPQGSLARFNLTVTGGALAVTVESTPSELASNPPSQESKLPLPQTDQAKTKDERPSVQKANLNPSLLAWLVIGIVLGAIGGILVRTYNVLGVEEPSVFTEIDQWAKALKEPDSSKVARRLFELKYPYTPYAEHFEWIGLDATPGITATNALSTEVNMWKGIGITSSVVISRLFELKYPTSFQLISNWQANESQQEGVNPNVAGLASQQKDENSNVAGLYAGVAIEECDRLKSIYDDNQFQDAMEISPDKRIQKLATITQDPKLLREIVEALCTN